jgi:ribA/ribD-fused uncharacterized protein
MTVETRTYNPADAAVFCKTKERFGGLSNMAGGFPLRVNEINILTSEALYQACRFPTLPEVQRLIIEQRSPMTAKMKSKPYRHQSRPDWEEVRVRIMRWCLRVKLAQNWVAFGDLLLSTDSLPIVELSTKDDFWGAKVQEDGTLVGRNALGRLLMWLREELKRATGEDLKRVEPVCIADFLLYDKPIGVVHASGETSHDLPAPQLTTQNGVLGGHVEEPSTTSIPAEHIASVEPMDDSEAVSPAAELAAWPVLAAADTCYTRCLPLLLQCLQREQPSDQQLAQIAQRLDVLPQQLNTWIERSMREGKVEKIRTNTNSVYIPTAPKQDLSLIDRGGGDAA